MEQPRKIILTQKHSRNLTVISLIINIHFDLKSPEEFLGVVEYPERPKLCITGTPGTSGKRKRETSSTETESNNIRERKKKAKKKAKHRKKSKTKANKQATKPDDSSATIHYVNSVILVKGLEK